MSNELSAASALTSWMSSKDGDGSNTVKPASAAAAAAAGGTRVLRPYPYFYYVDHSTEKDSDPLTPLTFPGRVPNFPAKLHAILSQPELEEIIDWLPHGRSWRVLKPREFETKIIPKFFEHSKFSSFVRQANGWGFRRITQGPDRNSYYHEKFLRGLPHLCKTMKRPGVAEKRIVDPDLEPDFYKISKIHPVPASADEESIFLQKTLESGPKARMPIVTSHFQAQRNGCVSPGGSVGTGSPQATSQPALVAKPASPTNPVVVDEASAALLPRTHVQEEAVVYAPSKAAAGKAAQPSPGVPPLPLLRLPPVANCSPPHVGAGTHSDSPPPAATSGPHHETVTRSTQPANKAPEPASPSTSLRVSLSYPQLVTGSMLPHMANYGARPAAVHADTATVAGVAAPTDSHIAAQGELSTAPTASSPPPSIQMAAPAPSAATLPAQGPTSSSSSNALAPTYAIVPIKPNTGVITPDLHPKLAYVPHFPTAPVDPKSAAASSFAAGFAAATAHYQQHFLSMFNKMAAPDGVQGQVPLK